MVAEKNEVVAVEVEPGVFAYKAVQTKAIIKTQEDVPRYAKNDPFLFVSPPKRLCDQWILFVSKIMKEREFHQVL